MQDYILKYQPEAASNNDMVWAFDLGKGSIGEAMRRVNGFLHNAATAGNGNSFKLTV